MSTATAAGGATPSPLPAAPASPLSPPVRSNAALDANDVAKRMLSFDLNAGTTLVPAPPCGLGRQRAVLPWAVACGTWGLFLRREATLASCAPRESARWE